MDQVPSNTGGSTSRLFPLVRDGEFVTRQGSKLMLGTQEFRFLGNNIYFLQAEIAYGNETAVAEVLDKTAELGFSVVRTHAFNNSPFISDYAAIQLSPGVYREVNLVALDKAVAAVKGRNLRLILNLVNYWNDYGGINRYIEWYRAQCGCEATAKEFYSNPVIKGWYKNYVQMLLNRTNTITGVKYKDEAAILAWELGNELRAEETDPTTMLNWIEEMAAFIKSQAPNHLVADGGEGFDDNPAPYQGLSNLYPVQGNMNSSYHRLVNLPSLDMVSYHMYPDFYRINTTTDAAIWIKAHEAIARQAGKVAYLGEYGLTGVGDQVRATAFDQWLKANLIEVRSAGSILWQMPYEVRPDYDGFSVYPAQHNLTITVLRRYAAMLAPTEIVITRLSPSVASTSAVGFLLTVNGKNLSRNATVLWNGEKRRTTFVNSNTLRARITPSDLAKAGMAVVSVMNKDGTVTNGLPMRVVQR